MISRLHLTVLIFLAFAITGISAKFSGGELSFGWLKSLGGTVSIVLILLTIFYKWGWRWKFLQGWFVKRPYIWGEWEVILKSEWKNPKTGKKKAPIKGKYIIKQNLSSLKIRLETSESKGDLISSNIIDKGDGDYSISGLYRNEPGIEVRKNSQIHNGAFLLDIIGPPNKGAL